jgi:hypothetical protein
LSMPITRFSASAAIRLRGSDVFMPARIAKPVLRCLGYALGSIAQWKTV